MPCAQPCPACGATGPMRPWRRAPDHEPGSGNTWLLARCCACGTARTQGPAPALEVAYGTGAYAPAAPRGAGLAAPLLDVFDRRRERLLRRIAQPPGPLLDVGAGRGRFVAYARAHGWNARGIDPSPRTYAPHVTAETLEDADVAPGSLGAISLWHVLEHVEAPAAALEHLHGWLRPGGALLVGVPNLASAQARVGGPRWYHLDLPRHRTHFTAAGLAALLERSGFALVTLEHGGLEHNPFGLWQSALNRVTPTQSWLYHALKRNAAVRPADALPTLAALALAPPAAALEALAGLGGRGGTVAALAVARGRVA